jgi:hypothetical protein
MPSIAAIVRQFGSAYLAQHRAEMLPSHRRALSDLGACRTATLGGHVAACDRCAYEHYVYHSCRNRSCTQCHDAATAAWLAARDGELLPVPYFHVVFTLPSELRALVRSHQRELLAALMTTAAESLQTLAADPHYVGGTLGILAVLHTWTRALIYHPHVHCLVPAGAVASDGAGTWRPARADFLVPVPALSARFRARFLAQVRRVLPHVILPSALWRTPWVVYCKPTVQGSGTVLRYLARYVHRVAITDARIVALGHDTVTFRYHASRDGHDPRTAPWRTMTLGGDEFLRRFLQHVLPRGFHKVRYYGFWRPQAAGLRTSLQQQLAPVAPRHSSPPTAESTTQGDTEWLRPCPRCALGMLRVVRRLPRVRGPLATPESGTTIALVVASGLPP